MFCPNCGTKNEDSSLFCENCGTSLAEVAQELAAPAAEPAATPVVEPVVTPVEESAATPVVEPVVTPVAEPVATPVAEPVTPAESASQTTESMGQPVMNQQAMSQAQPKKPFKIPAWVFAVAGGALALIIALVAFVAIGVGASDYKKTAKKYVTAVEEGKFNKAYDYLALPSSEFLTEEMYLKANEGNEISKITNIAVTDTYAAKPVEDVTRTVNVKYILSSGMVEYDTVTMQKSGKKAMLFFNKYDVSTEGVVVSDVLVSVPKGFSLTVNGVSMGEGYLSKDNTSKYSDIYKVPYAFVGKMTVKAKHDVYGEVEKEVTVDRYSSQMTVASFSTNEFEVPSDVQTKLSEKAKSDLSTIMTAALNKKSYSDISSLVSPSATETVKSDYEYLSGRVHSSYRTTTALTVSNVTATVKTTQYSVDSETRNPIVRVNLNYTLTGQYTTSYSDKPYDGKTTVTGTSYYIIYMYENGDWKISDTNLQAYLYNA